MKKNILDALIKAKVLRVRQKDINKTRSLINSAEINAMVAEKISLDDNSSTLIFREFYESIRQMGDAKWTLLGYEPLNHEVSLDILRDMDVSKSNQIKLNLLSRFKRIRHDANYRGFRVTINQAKEIIDFWNTCGKEMLHMIKKEIK